ncbi:hypothetical protein VNPA141581_59080 [Pseudomonas aeruginosa]|nr:hypothetical protein VNPA141581_59080 [Pseudomonas aeruginosa]
MPSSLSATPRYSYCPQFISVPHRHTYRVSAEDATTIDIYSRDMQKVIKRSCVGELDDLFDYRVFFH